VLAALGGADEACHARLTALQPAARYSFDPRPQPGLQRHITQQWQTALEAQGLLVPKCTHQRPGRRTVGISPEIRARGVAILREIGATGEPLVLLHPGSGGREKCWPLANFVAVAEALRAGGATPCFLLGPVEIEWWHEAELAGLGRRFPVLRLPAADTLAAALAAAQVVIANDSGPAHLAALLGTATIAVFGPTSASVWQPLGRHVRVVAGDPQVSPSDWGIPPSDIVDLLATG
jgi:ADP-heptose:LPS heptosyltransferase